MEIKKKHLEPDSGPEAKDRRNSTGGMVLQLILSIAVVGIIIWVLAWALRGSEKSSGQYPANVTKEPLYCETTDLKYKKISSTNSDDTRLELTLIFSGTTDLRSIFLSYAMAYADEETARAAETFSHADFNRDLTAAGYEAGKFDDKFSVYNNTFSVSLYAEAKEIDTGSIQYFALNDDDNKTRFVMPRTLDEFKAAYEAKGFTCSSTKE